VLIMGGNSWVARLPDGSVVTFRVAGDASAATDAATATVEVNSQAVKAMNNGQVAKFKFPGHA
jgi:filamentous hemagglutinin